MTTVIPTARPSAALSSFLDAGTAEGLDTSCVAQGANPAPTFHLPSATQ